MPLVWRRPLRGADGGRPLLRRSTFRGIQKVADKGRVGSEDSCIRSRARFLWDWWRWPVKATSAPNTDVRALENFWQSPLGGMCGCAMPAFEMLPVAPVVDCCGGLWTFWNLKKNFLFTAADLLLHMLSL